MPKCFRCRKNYKQWKSSSELGDSFTTTPDGLCLDCLAELKAQRREFAVDKLGGETAHTHFVVTDIVKADVTSWSGRTSFHYIGDLFVTEGGLAYVPYARFLMEAPMDAADDVAATIVLGVVGTILYKGIGHLEDRQTVENAKARAELERNQDFGTGVVTRMSNRYDSLAIDRADVVAIETDAKGYRLSIQHADGTFTGTLKDAQVVQDKLRAWLAGRVEDEPDVQGANLGLPAVSDLLAQLEQAASRPETSSEMLEKVASQPKIFDAFHRAFQKQKRHQRLAIAATIGAQSHELGDALNRRLRWGIDRILGQVSFYVGLGVLILFIIGAAFDMIVRKTPVQTYVVGEGLAALLLMLGLSAALLISGVYERRFYRRLRELLLGKA
jgi:uncharacterized membrane protein YraQ (UPF0718 family)